MLCGMLEAGDPRRGRPGGQVSQGLRVRTLYRGEPVSERMTELEAGPELDALIAERVYGHRVVWLRNASDRRLPWIFDNATVVYDVRGTGMGWVCGITDDNWQVYHRGALILPRYSADVAAAWQVVEALRSWSWLVRVEGVPMGYTVAFYTHAHPLTRPGAFHSAPTLPHAVCLAALDVVALNKA